VSRGALHLGALWRHNLLVVGNVRAWPSVDISFSRHCFMTRTDWRISSSERNNHADLIRAGVPAAKVSTLKAWQ
jgi:hypothetical protein